MSLQSSDLFANPESEIYRGAVGGSGAVSRWVVSDSFYEATLDLNFWTQWKLNPPDNYITMDVHRLTSNNGAANASGLVYPKPVNRGRIFMGLNNLLSGGGSFGWYVMFCAAKIPTDNGSHIPADDYIAVGMQGQNFYGIVQKAGVPTVLGPTNFPSSNGGFEMMILEDGVDTLTGWCNGGMFINAYHFGTMFTQGYLHIMAIGGNGYCNGFKAFNLYYDDQATGF